jgi:hypothetical protein
MIEHIWRPETGITEIEGDWHALRASEVEGIRVVWGEQRELLKGSGPSKPASSKTFTISTGA